MKILREVYKGAAERVAMLRRNNDWAGPRSTDMTANPVTTAKPISRLYIETLKSSLLNELYIENETRIVQMLARKLNNLDRHSKISTSRSRHCKP